MAFTTYATVIPGSMLTAAFWNQQVRDNGIDIRSGGLSLLNQTAGDILWAKDGTHWDRLPLADPALMPLGGNPVSSAYAIGKHTLWLPAGAWSPAIDAPCGFLTDIGTASYCPILGMAFDPNVRQYASTILAMPKQYNFNTTVTGRIYWTKAGSGVGSVSWYGYQEHYIDGENYQAAPNLQAWNQVDAAINTLYLHVTDPFELWLGSQAVFPRLTRIELMRYVDDSADTLTDLAYFLGMLIEYRTNLMTDL